MKADHPSTPWRRLVGRARGFIDSRDTSAPFGFAGRVAALAWQGRASPAALFERFALKALTIACLLAIGSAALNYSALLPPETAEDETVLEDPIGVLLDS